MLLEEKYINKFIIQSSVITFLCLALYLGVYYSLIYFEISSIDLAYVNLSAIISYIQTIIMSAISLYKKYIKELAYD